MEVRGRKRGDDNLGTPYKALDAAVMGLSAAYLSIGGGHSAVDYVLLAVSMAVALSISYGNSWGAIVNQREFYSDTKWSWWEINTLFIREEPLYNMILRGVLGGVVMVPASLYVGTVGPIVAVPIGFVAASHLAPIALEGREVPKWLHWLNINVPGKERWNLAELIRGWVMGIVAWL